MTGLTVPPPSPCPDRDGSCRTGAVEVPYSGHPGPSDSLTDRRSLCGEPSGVGPAVVWGGVGRGGVQTCVSSFTPLLGGPGSSRRESQVGSDPCRVPTPSYDGRTRPGGAGDDSRNRGRVPETSSHPAPVRTGAPGGRRGRSPPRTSLGSTPSTSPGPSDGEASPLWEWEGREGRWEGF